MLFLIAYTKTRAANPIKGIQYAYRNERNENRYLWQGGISLQNFVLVVHHRI